MTCGPTRAWSPNISTTRRGYRITPSNGKARGGTTARIEEFTYTQRTVAGLGTIWPVTAEKAFRNANGTGALTTSYAYLWHTGTAALQPSKITTTFPVVPTTENGTGVADTSEKHFDALGYLTKEVDAVGTANTFDYDKLRDARTVQVRDEGSGRLNLRTDYLPDDQGRTIRALGPEHTIDIGGTATAIRSAIWTYYKGSSGETWKIRGYRKVSDDSDHTVGAVSIELRNVAGDRPAGKAGWRMDWSVAATYSGSGIPSASASFGSLFPRTSWDSWKIGLYDKASELREQWTYWQIPSGTGFGTVDVDYGNKRLDYDVAGRQNQTTCAVNTTDRITYNAMGWPVSEELGIDANPATYTVTRSNEYADDGNLTKATLPVDSNTANDRVTDYRYDWRGRLEEIETKVQKDASEGSGEWTLITRYGHDNRGLLTSETTYHTSVSDSNRTALSEMEYDSRRRRYRTKAYEVASDGVASNPQEGNVYWGGNGKVLKDAPAGSKLFTATEYNAVGWPQTIYQAYDTGTSPTAPPFTTNSTVVEQTENDYDDAGNRSSVVSKQRYDDATGTGPLAGTGVRTTFLARYPDAFGRILATANYGTNDDAAWTRPGTIPPRTGITPVQPRVASYSYDPLGNEIRQTDPAGIHTEKTWDKASRLTETIENWLASPAADTRATRFEYTSDGWLKKLISLNPDTSISGEQVTEWIYGVTKGTGSTDSLVNSKRLVREKIFPDASQPVVFRYDIQLEIFGKTDQLGTVHAYDYDKMGRLISDSVSAFGSGVDTAVGKLSNGYNNRGLLIRSSSHNTAGTTVLNEIAWDYNGFNQPVAEYQEHSGPVDRDASLKVGYSYADGSANTIRPTGIKYPHVGTGSATTVAIEYSGTMANALSSPDQIKDGSDVLSSWRYVGLGMIAAQKYDAAANAELTYGDSSDAYSGYNAFGEIAATLWKSGSTVLVESQYGRNAVGDVEWRRDLLADTILSPTTQDDYFWYDGLHQVTRHDRGELTPAGGPPPYTGIAPATRQQQEDFTYDETGNWKGYQTASPVLVQTRTHNVANQILTLSGPSGVITPPVYDGAGNMTTIPSPGNWTVGYTCKWDAWNRLVEVKQGSTPVGTYTYDAGTRRIRKAAAAETRDYYFDQQWRAIEERVSNSVKADYVFSPFDRWNLIRRRRVTSGSAFNETRFVLRDYLDPVAIISTTGSVEERYGYSAFGSVRFMNANFGTLSSSGCDWTWLFHGEFIDAESGLYNYGFRYYHPQLGRWISRDPIGEADGFNVYVAISNNPVNYTDSYGTAKTMGPPDCCNPCHAAKLAGKDDGDVGGVICCNGKEYSCLWISGGATGATNDKAKKIIDKCAGKHEDTHHGDQECTGNELDRPPIKDSKNLDKEECYAYKTENKCLKKSKKDCNGDASCESQVDAEMQNNQGYIDKHCGAAPKRKRPMGHR